MWYCSFDGRIGLFLTNNSLEEPRLEGSEASSYHGEARWYRGKATAPGLRLETGFSLSSALSIVFVRT